MAQRDLHFLDEETEEGELTQSDGEDVVGCCLSLIREKPLMKDASTSTTDLNTAAGSENDEDSDSQEYIEMRRAHNILGPLPLYLMDFQGFEGLGNEFIVKEMAILERDDEHHVTTHHYFFKSPYPETMLRTSDTNALHRAKHGLRWSGNGAGQTHLPYSELERLVRGTVGRWLQESSQPIKIFLYGYEKITLLNTLLDNKENVEYMDLSSPYLFHEMPNLEKLMTTTGPYCPEHYLLNYVETLRMKLAGDKGYMDRPQFCALNVVNVSHDWIMQSLFKDRYFCRKLFMLLKNEI